MIVTDTASPMVVPTLQAILIEDRSNHHRQITFHAQGIDEIERVIWLWSRGSQCGFVVELRESHKSLRVMHADNIQDVATTAQQVDDCLQALSSGAPSPAFTAESMMADGLPVLRFTPTLNRA